MLRRITICGLVILATTSCAVKKNKTVVAGAATTTKAVETVKAVNAADKKEVSLAQIEKLNERAEAVSDYNPDKIGTSVVYKKLPSSLEYKFLKRNAKGQKATVGSETKIHIITKIADSVVFDSKKINKDAPVPAPITAPKFKGDLQEGFAMMREGEVALFRAPIDSVIRNKAQMPPFAKSGDFMSFQVTMVSVKTAEQLKVDAEKAGAEEEKAIKEYIKKENLGKKVYRTASGLYYVITKTGTGANAKNGQTVSMNYTGYLLNGNKFDSNVDPAFNHVEPFEFPLGQGRVIKGWDEGIALLNKGAKAKLIIPSRLGYGSRAMGEKIPANSVLVFDVEMLGTK